MANSINHREPLLSRIINFFTGEQDKQKETLRLKRAENSAKTEALLLSSIGESRIKYKNLSAINELRLGKVHVHGLFRTVKSRNVRNNLRITEALFEDETGRVLVVWFNGVHSAYIKKGVIYELTGVYKLNKNKFNITNPSFRLLSEGCIEDKNKVKITPNHNIQKPYTTTVVDNSFPNIIDFNLAQDIDGFGAIDKFDEINNFEPIQEGDIVGDKDQLAGVFNKYTNTDIDINHAENTDPYSLQSYSLTKGAPKKWKTTDVNLNSQSVNPSSFWGQLRIQAWSRDNYTCQNNDCDSEDLLTVHHKVPLSIGGTNELNNLTTLCRKHHELVHDRKIYNTGKDFGDVDNYGRNYELNDKIKTIKLALDTHNDLIIDYNDIKHIHTNRRITPKRLYIKNNRKYLEAYCHLRNAKRTFRVARIESKKV